MSNDVRTNATIGPEIEEIAREMAVEMLRRYKWRRAQKNESDGRQRITVGARVPRWQAARYRLAARNSQRSMYRFVLDALDREAERVERPPWRSEPQPPTQPPRILEILETMGGS